VNFLQIEKIRIAGVTACLPKTEIANDDKVARATGIVSRRRAEPGTTVVDLCVTAAEKALDETGARTEDFGAILCVSFTQTARMPAAAIQAQARLGLPKDVLAFDVSLACSGWAYGLYLAGLLTHQTGKKTLLLDGDVQSAFVDAADANTVPLLADGGTATIIEPGDDTFRFAFLSDGAKGDALRLEHGSCIRMNGFGVFQFVAKDVVAAIREFQTGNGPFDRFVPHQPNAYMVRQLAKSVGFDEGATALSCDRFGNLSSASVPTTIAAGETRGRLLVAGFGGGLSISLGAITVDDACRLSTVER